MEAQHSHPAHGVHADHSMVMFRNRFWLCLALTLPVVFWSSEVQRWHWLPPPTFSGSRSIPAILGTFIFVYGGKVVIQGARYELSGHKPGMMTLISVGIVFVFAASLTSSLGCSKLTPVRRTGSSYAISDLTLLTMTQLRRLVRSTFNG